MKIKTFWYWILVTTIFVGCMVINAIAIKAPYFIDDDADIVAGVTQINFSLKNIYLPVGYVHGPISFYITKISGLFFGQNPVGYRIIQYFFILFLIVVIFLTAKEIFGKVAGLFALVLSGFNFFFIYNANYIGEEIYFLVFNFVALSMFFLAIQRSKQKYVILSAFFIGLGFLTKLTTGFLFVALLLYIIFNRKYFCSIRKSTWFISSTLVAFMGGFYLLYVFWVTRADLFLFREYTDVLLGLGFPISIVNLFVGSWIYFGKEILERSLEYCFGWNILLPVQGIMSFIGILFVIFFRKNEFTNLLSTVVFSTFIIAAAVFSGSGVEPRHFSFLVIVGVLALAYLLDSLWKRRKLFRVIVLVILISICIESAIYTAGLEHYYYPLHSKVNLSSWGRAKESVNLNDLVKEYIQACSKYQPTLVVFPSYGLDSIGLFFTAYTNKKTLSPLMFYRALVRYVPDDLERIIVFLSPEDNIDPFLKWANKNGYSYRTEDRLLEPKGNKLPIKILYMSKETSEPSPSDIKTLRSVIFKD